MRFQIVAYLNTIGSGRGGRAAAHDFSNIAISTRAPHRVPLLATAESIEAPAVLLLIMAKHVDVSVARLNPEILG
jgi:hypothetical protein